VKRCRSRSLRGAHALLRTKDDMPSSGSISHIAWRGWGGVTDGESEGDFVLFQKLAVLRLQRWWRSCRDRKAFWKMAATLRRCEKARTLDVLRHFLPDEHAFLSDRGLPASRLRLRLSGLTYPPTLMYKIVLPSTKNLYFSGTRNVRPGTAAAADAIRVMGPAKALEALVMEPQLPQRNRRLAKGEVRVQAGGKQSVWQVLAGPKTRGATTFNDNLAVLEIGAGVPPCPAAHAVQPCSFAQAIKRSVHGWQEESPRRLQSQRPCSKSWQEKLPKYEWKRRDFGRADREQNVNGSGRTVMVFNPQQNGWGSFNRRKSSLTGLHVDWAS